MERFMDRFAYHWTTAPMLEGDVGPLHAQVGTEDGNPLAEHLEDALVLQQRGGAVPELRVARRHKDAVKRTGPVEQSQAFRNGAGAYDVPAGRQRQCVAAVGMFPGENKDP